jgi:hypothetical protein
MEGFCELIAFKLMSRYADALELRTIRENAYTRGQLQVFLALDDVHGFHRILEWMKKGLDPQVEMADLDRVKNIRIPAPPPVTRIQALPAAVPVKMPDRLVLKGISGGATRRFALINDQTFAPLDERRVRVGATHVTVKCWEISAEAVSVSIEGGEERITLRLDESR